MPDIFQELDALLSPSRFGTESLSLESRDKIHAFGQRFLTNLKNLLSDFSQTEWQHYHNRYHHQLIALYQSSVVIPSILVAIPKAMRETYGKTLSILQSILDQLGATHLITDIDAVIIVLGTAENSTYPRFAYTKAQFEDHKTAIGNLYTRNGPTHMPCDQCLGSLSDVQAVDHHLGETVNDMFPLTLALHTHLERLEKAVMNTADHDPLSKDRAACLMVLAYRLSIFAIVMDHLQDMEHAFLKALDAIRLNVRLDERKA